MADQSNFESIVELADIDSAEKATRYLKLGWVLLNVESTQYAEHGWSTSYALGWKKELGEVRYPEPTEYEKLRDEGESLINWETEFSQQGVPET